MKSKNPFTRNRAEQMGEYSWKYFVREPFNNLLSEKPLVFEGSRGCGKTMFFLCNSWKEKFSEYDVRQFNHNELFNENEIIGFYHKIDGRFVGHNLSGKGVEDYVWHSIFNTYFNIIISKEIINFIKECLKREFLLVDDIKILILKIQKKLRVNENPELDVLLGQFDEILDDIEYFSNDPEEKKPIGLIAGTLINLIIEELKKLLLFNKTRFHIFIDEFEELNFFQQKQLNTLLKQGKYWLVYDIGVKTNGYLTKETLSGEIIRQSDDYNHYYPEIDSYERHQEYVKLLISICTKRLNECISEELISNSDFSNIEFYLKDYGKEIELKEFSNSSKFPKLQQKLQRIIEDDIDYQKANPLEKKEIINHLVDQSPDIVRMHLSLLYRKSVNVLKLYQEKKEESSKYKDWKHNTLFATHFLLCKEFDLVKKYQGVNTFAQLSSGVIRSFLEICESAFDYAFSRNFSFENPRPLTIEEQTNAAHYVSQNKVSKIEGFIPDGAYLKRFVLSLGRIFFNKHTSPNTTLGEPEPNHFYTKPLELKTQFPEASKVLENAVMHNVVQIDLPTKEKNTEGIETTDYHLNHIYCPYFKISHRRKRKIYLEPTDLKTLLIGTSRDIERTIKSISMTEKNGLQGTIEFN